jgi:hypothetical protein
VADYRATVKDGIGKLSHVQEVLKLFPGAPTDHMILEFGVSKEQPVVWSTEVYFGGRYNLAYQVYINVDYAKKRIIQTTSKPEFVLFRVGRTYKASSDTIGADISEDHKFDEAGWEKVVAAKGDFSVIGIKIDTNSVVPGFDEFVKGQRESRIHVE